MSREHSNKFNAPAEEVWQAILSFVEGAGYDVDKVDASQKRIVYRTSRSIIIRWAWNRMMIVSVSDAGNNQAVVTMRAETMGQFMVPIIMEWLEYRLLQRLLTELEARFVAGKRQERIGIG